MTRQTEHRLLVRLRLAYSRALRLSARGPVPRHASDNLDQAIADIIAHLGVTENVEWQRDAQSGFVIAVGIVDLDDVLLNRHNKHREYLANGHGDAHSQLFAKTLQAYARLNTVLHDRDHEQSMFI